MQGHADLDPILAAHVGVERVDDVLHLLRRQADLRLTSGHEVVGVKRVVATALEAGLAQRGHEVVQIGDGVLKVEDVRVWHGVAGEGHEACAAERLEAILVANRRRLVVAVGATHKGADAFATWAKLGVGLAGDGRHFVRQPAVRVNAVVEVERRDPELGHQRQTNAVEATHTGRMACGCE